MPPSTIAGGSPRPTVRPSAPDPEPAAARPRRDEDLARDGVTPPPGSHRLATAATPASTSAIPATRVGAQEGHQPDRGRTRPPTVAADRPPRIRPGARITVASASTRREARIIGASGRRSVWREAPEPRRPDPDAVPAAVCLRRSAERGRLPLRRITVPPPTWARGGAQAVSVGRADATGGTAERPLADPELPRGTLRCGRPPDHWSCPADDSRDGTFGDDRHAPDPSASVSTGWPMRARRPGSRAIPSSPRRGGRVAVVKFAELRLRDVAPPCIRRDGAPPGAGGAPYRRSALLPAPGADGGDARDRGRPSNTPAVGLAPSGTEACDCGRRCAVSRPSLR